MMVTGKNSLGRAAHPDETISRADALRLYTANTAWFLREEDLGSIKTGSLGDVVVLDRDYFTVAEDEIKSVSAVLTIMGGRVVHDAGAIRKLKQ